MKKRSSSILFSDHVLLGVVFVSAVFGMMLFFTLFPFNQAAAVDCWCGTTPPERICEHYSAGSGVTNCGSAPGPLDSSAALSYCNNYCANLHDRTWRAAFCDETGYIDRTESGNGSCPSAPAAPSGASTVCECSTGTHTATSCGDCRTECTRAGGEMTGFGGVSGTVCDATDTAILSEAVCQCADGTTAPVSGATLTDCCAACSTPSARAESVQYSGASEACPAAPSVPVGSGTETPLPEPVQLYNPLGTDVTVTQFIGRGIRAVIGIVGALALLMFIYGGITWMTAGGSQERVTSAKNILKNSFIGILLIFFSYTIISIFFSFFNG